MKRRRAKTRRRVGTRYFLAGAIFSFSLAASFLGSPAQGQSVQRPSEAKVQTDIRATAAYAEVLLKRTQYQAELEALTAEYTDDHPKTAEARFAFESADREKTKLLATRGTDINRLTGALGKLILGKIDAEVELWSLRRSLQEAHPDVKRAKRKVEIYEAAIREILG